MIELLVMMQIPPIVKQITVLVEDHFFRLPKGIQVMVLHNICQLERVHLLI